jgi:hypothetical protein
MGLHYDFMVVVKVLEDWDSGECLLEGLQEL